MKIASSNPKKLAEYQALMPSITPLTISDLKEVKSNKDDVILYKVKNLNQELVLVEDTILELNINHSWSEIVDIKYTLKTHQTPCRARWVVSVGIKENDAIKVYRGIVEGDFIPARYQPEPNGFFDSVFFPDNANGKSLLELEEMNLKTNFSARRKVIKAILNNKPVSIHSFSTLPEWKGEYQS